MVATKPLDKLSEAARDAGEAVVAAGQSMSEPLSESELGQAEFFEQQIEISLDRLYKEDPKRDSYCIACQPTPTDRVLDYLEDRFTGWDIFVEENGLVFMPR